MIFLSFLMFASDKNSLRRIYYFSMCEKMIIFSLYSKKKNKKKISQN